jgi:lantibiotic modifying enzyme
MTGDSAARLRPSNVRNEQAKVLFEGSHAGEGNFVPMSRTIGLQLAREATELPDGSITWGRGYDSDFAAICDAGIFNARLGEALYFAALFKATRDPSFESICMRAAVSLCGKLEAVESARSLVRRLGVGLTGVGSIIYAFVRISEFLGRSDLLTYAARAAAAISRETIENENKLEVFFGTAGALLGFLALADTGNQDAAERAIWCGRHLLERRILDPRSGARAWATSAQVPWAGFAHGSSGIAHALLKLALRVGDDRYYEAAIEAFSFERTVYSEEIQDWPDFVDQPPDRIITGWCHGAPGIGLSRLSALDMLRPCDESDIAHDLRLALARTTACRAAGTDSLCCGTFGRVDFLLEAGSRLRNSSAIAAAYSLAETALRRSKPGGFSLAPPDEKPHWGTGLWQGLAGIGYLMLRLSEPSTYPSILRFD